jgi:hypothetical protein
MPRLLADVAAPIFWGGICHLALGNAVLGLLEGALIAWVFRRAFDLAVPLMVLANYFSSLVGLALLDPLRLLVESWLPEPPLSHVFRAHLLFLGLTFPLTVVLEWPFCWAVVGLSRGQWKRALWASLLAQTASYLLLVPYYKAFSLYHVGRLEPDLAFVRSPLATVYYIRPADGSVWKVRTDGSGREQVLPAWPEIPLLTDPTAWLQVKPSEQKDRLDLWVMDWNWPKQEGTLLLKGFVPAPAGPRPDRNSDGAAKDHPLGVVDLQGEDLPPWAVHTHAEGVGLMEIARRRTQGFEIEDIVGVMTPLLRWPCKNVTILPGHQLVFQMGDQVCLLDLETRTLGVLAMGRGPAVLLDAADTAARNQAERALR